MNEHTGTRRARLPPSSPHLSGEATAHRSRRTAPAARDSTQSEHEWTARRLRAANKMAASSNKIELFSLVKTKETFEQMQWSYIKKKSRALAKGTLQLWSREKINAYIEIILNFKNKEIDFHPMPKEVVGFDVVISNTGQGTYKLVSRSKMFPDKYLEVLAWEDCFDVIVKAHRLHGHRGGPPKMLYKYVQKKYIIDKIWIALLLRACNVCKSSANIFPTPPLRMLQYYKCYQVLIKSVRFEHDSPFGSILIVVEKMSNFVQVRPVSNIHAPMQEVTLELLKIFADFGIPNLIETNISYIENVRTYLKSFFNDNDIRIPSFIGLAENNLPWFDLVIVNLQDWMNVSGSKNWALGCQIVQWQINNKSQEKTTPYKQLFHMEPISEILD